jgi:hypothetical protein
MVGKSRILMLVVIGMLISLAPGVAQAQTSTSSPQGSGQPRQYPETSLYSSATTGGATPDTIEATPSGCYQRADNPHLSTHYGNMSGDVWAICRNAIPEMYHTAQLWEKRWWGWDRIGTVGTFHRTWVSRGRATGEDRCRKNWIRVTGNGWIVDVDYRKYYASTESNHIYNPCGL